VRKAGPAGGHLAFADLGADELIFDLARRNSSIAGSMTGIRLPGRDHSAPE
jgi:hypothetical protein